jgi:hypothetical protein
MTEQDGSDLQHTNSQSMSSAKKTKTGRAASGSFRCGIAGFLILLVLIILDFGGAHSLVMMSIVYPVLSIVSFVLSVIGLVMGIVSLVRIKVLSGRLQGSGFAIIGLIIGAIMITVWTLNIIDRKRFSRIKISPVVEVTGKNISLISENREAVLLRYSCVHNPYPKPPIQG